MPVTIGVAAAILVWAGAVVAQPAVDLELVLAVDGSTSIGHAAFELELDGHAAAFRDPAVVEAIRAGHHGRIAVTLALWSDPTTLDVLVPWTIIDDAGSSAAFAAAIDAVPRHGRSGSTAIGAALLHAAGLFPSTASAPRRVIDIVSNGYNNAGMLPELARNRVIGEGTTINALVILDEVPWLGTYFAERVIGGSGAFVRGVDDWSGFVQAIADKLKREVAGSAGRATGAALRPPG